MKAPRGICQCCGKNVATSIGWTGKPIARAHRPAGENRRVAEATWGVRCYGSYTETKPAPGGRDGE